MASVSGLSSDFFAEPMLDTKEYLNEYRQQLEELIQNNSLPDLSKKMNYEVYSIKGQGFGAHKSIVLAADGKYFTIELIVKEFNRVNHIYPRTRPLQPNVHKLSVCLGQLETTGFDLLNKGIATMQWFGDYSKLHNNCQDYCNFYLEVIGLKNQTSLTDGDKAKIFILVAACVLGVIVCSRLKQKSK